MGSFSTTSKSSGSFISGTPFSVKTFDFYDQNYISLLTNAMDEVLTEYQKSVRTKARAAWGDLADTITISFNPHTFEVEFTAAPEAHNLEYGDESHSPSAILRNAATEASQQLPARIMAKISGAQ